MERRPTGFDGAPMQIIASRFRVEGNGARSRGRHITPSTVPTAGFLERRKTSCPWRARERVVREAIAGDRRLAGRLALWARRLVGEAITQSQAVIAEHDRLADLIMQGTGDLAGIGRLIDRITSAHTQRLKVLGLSS